MQETKLLLFLITDLQKRGWEREKVRALKLLIKKLNGISDWREREREKHEIWQQLRAGYTQVAARKVETEYQSPSFRQSLWSEAGSREGQVSGNMNDYTRDQHPLAYELGQELKRVYQPKLKGIEAHVTISGMAALTTIFNTLGRLRLANRIILVGKESYFQNREALAIWGNKVRLFDELDLREFEKILKKERPAAVMVDSLSNTEKLVKPNLTSLQKIISNQASDKTYLVIDNSLLGPGVGFKELWKIRGKCETIIWESLNKYYQYGMDHVTGGVIYARGIKLNGVIFQARMHAGTILPDYQCLMFPRQSSRMMEQYQIKINENKELLAKLLRDGGKKIRLVEGSGFSGAQIVLELDKISPLRINLLIGKVIREARKRGVQISAGTSFGLASTRIYLTARKTSYTRMFVRISVGWECTEAIREIGEVLLALI